MKSVLVAINIKILKQAETHQKSKEKKYVKYNLQRALNYLYIYLHIYIYIKHKYNKSKIN